MPGTELHFEHEIDLPANVVWDALVDPVLLEGWLGAVDPSPLSSDQVTIEWLDGRLGGGQPVAVGNPCSYEQKRQHSLM